MIEKIKRLYSSDHPIKLQLFNVILSTVLLFGIPSVFIMLVEKYGRDQLPAIAIIIAVAILSLFIANRFNKLNLAAALIISVVTLVLFPVMFFTGGGIYSAMPAYFALSIVFLFMLIDGKLFCILFVAQILVFAICYEVAYRYPNAIIPLGSTEDIFMDSFIGILMVGIVIGTINKMSTRSYEKLLKKLEEQNEALKISEQKAEQANKAKSDFLSSMSHEIRTPINAVIGMNEMIKRESKSKDILEYSAAIESSAGALLTIINDILDFSKIESGKMTIVNDKYDLFSLINDSYCMLKERAEEKGLSISVECDENIPAYLNGDIIRIRQIIVNLLTNAVKYTESGNICLLVSGERTGDEYKLKTVVKDTGIGMKPEEVNRLFNKFERLNLEHNQSIEGAGLGLTIVKQLVSLMNGTIEVKSQYEKGSEFCVIIPQGIEGDEVIGKATFGIGTSDTAQKEYKPSIVSENSTVLAVDDVQMNLFVFKKLVKDTKIQVDTATSGKQCLEMIKKKKYNIIFMDHMMPEMDGIETFDIIRSTNDHMNVDTPVVMLTANAIAGMEEQYKDKGFSEYLSKPIDVKKLELVIRKFLVSDDNNTEEGKNMECNVDVNVGIANCGGEKEFYVEILDEFLAEGKIEELQKCYDEKNWELYTIDVHSIKGTMRLIGANDAGEVAEKLQFAGEANDIATIDSLHSTLMEMIDISMDKIRAEVQ